MSDSIPEEFVATGLLPWLREEYYRPFKSGMGWGWERCRTEEERLLYPLLLLALSSYTALVAHRRMPEDGTVSFRVQFSRSTSLGPERLQWKVTDSLTERPEDDHDLIIPLTTELVRKTPWMAALHVVATIQSHLLKPPET